jgi:D-alanyl-lipoteichoic acid acyltransferase DltB (MBOAT superfamily)
VNFNSPQFLVFLPVTLGVFLALRRRPGWRDAWLLLASYVFYMSWNWKYAGLIAASTLLDYLLALAMARAAAPTARRALLIVSLIGNLGVLGLFKYHNFFVDTFAAATGADADWLHHRLLLPVGISFYTFQTLSYTIDVYRRRIPAERNLVKFALFVTFFPQLVAGPIVRAADFLPQLRREPVVSESRFNSGLALIFQGLFKKVVVADLLAGLAVDAVFADPSAFSSADLMLALYGYAFQIYCDFSGYSDIAIGTARLFGYDLCVNFNRPYLAADVREFWSRWHISLSTWLRDYLYIPLGGNRAGAWRTRFNLLVTMMLGGLWHGAAMNFVLWGLYHGLLLMLHRGGRPAGQLASWQIWRGRVVTFHLVLGGWLLFRAQGVDQLAQYLRGLAAFDLSTRLPPLYLGVLATAAGMHLVPVGALSRLRDRLAAAPAPLQAAVYTAMLLMLCSAAMSTPSFIYFQF